MHRRLWWTSHGPAVREVIILIIGSKEQSDVYQLCSHQQPQSILSPVSVQPQNRFSSSLHPLAQSQPVRLPILIKQSSWTSANSQLGSSWSEQPPSPSLTASLLFQMYFQGDFHNTKITTQTQFTFVLNKIADRELQLHQTCFFHLRFFFRVSAFLEWIAVAMQDFGSVQ